MKTKHIITLAASVLLGFASCSDDTENTGSSNDVRIDVTVAGASRTTPQAEGAASATFVSGDEIKVTAVGQPAAKYRYDGAEWTLLDKLLWKSNTMTVSAQYPADADIHGAIPTDQSTQQLIAAADYMYCPEKEVQFSESRAITLEMQRLTARVIVNAELNTELQNKDSEIKLEASLFDSRNVPVKAFAEGYRYAALLTPGAAEDKETFILFTLTFQGAERTMALIGIPELKVGNSYTFNVLVGEERVELLSQSVEAWTDGTLPGGNNIIADDSSEAFPDQHLIMVNNPGTLKASDITKALKLGGTELTIKGQMNGSDFKVLREAMGCKFNASAAAQTCPFTILDLTGTSFVAGGEAYAEGKTSDADNTLPAEVFAGAAVGSSPIEIKLPASVTVIGDGALRDANVKSMPLHEGITTIGNDAFTNTKISVITIPASVTSAGRLFTGCQEIAEIDIKPSSSVITAQVLDVPAERAGWVSLTLNESFCSKITNGNTMYGKQWGGFRVFDANGKNLGVEIDPATNTIRSKYIGGMSIDAIKEAAGTSGRLVVEGAINGTDLRELRKGAGCRYRELGPRDETTPYPEVLFTHLDMSKTEFKKGGAYFYHFNANGHDSYFFIEEDNVIPEKAFQGSSLVSVIIPDNCTKILAHAFNQANHVHTLAEIKINNKVELIEREAFASTVITSFVVPRSVKELYSAFSRCSQLETFTFEEGCQITVIRRSLLNNCEKISHIEIPATVKTIEGRAFESTNITDMVIPANVEKLYDNALQYCNTITKLTIKNPNLKIYQDDNNYPFVGLFDNKVDLYITNKLLNTPWVSDRYPRESTQDEYLYKPSERKWMRLIWKSINIIPEQ